MPCGFALKTDDDRVGCHLKEKHGISKKHRQKLNLLVISLHFPDPDELPKQNPGGDCSLGFQRRPQSLIELDSEM
ncbi:hypothetical protein DER44DRAFT_799270 [Fusarium oxysporum]|nr:hypothetical protein DER44DRAFT_799270 [Fusarium oxysporum]